MENQGEESVGTSGSEAVGERNLFDDGVVKETVALKVNDQPPSVVPDGDQGISVQPGEISSSSDRLAASEPALIYAPTPAPASHRRTSLTLLIGAAALLLIPSVWYIVNRQAAGLFPAQVSSFGLVPVNFANTGTVGYLPIHVGDQVRQGSILAVTSSSTARKAVRQDLQVLTADQIHLAQLEALSSSSSSNGTTLANANVSSASTQLQSAQDALNSIESSFSSEIAQQQSNIQYDQNVLATSTSLYSTNCPGGTSAAVSPTGLTQFQCIQLQNSMENDQQSYNSATELLASMEASQTQAVASANKSVNDARAQLALEQTSPASSTSYVATEITAVETQIAKDESQLASDRTSELQDRLVSPVSGTVVEINGSVGASVTSSGVNGIGTQSAGVSSSLSGSIFSSGGLEQITTSSSLPFIVIRTNAAPEITVLVSENRIRGIHLGEAAAFTPSVSGLQVLRGHVSEVGAFPLVAGGVARYPVVVSVTSSTTAGYLRGITGTATFG